MDFGCLGSIVRRPARERYVQTLLRLTKPGADYVLSNFAADLDRRSTIVPTVLHPGEADRLLGGHFDTETHDGAHGGGPFGLGIEFRRMRRK